LGGKDIFKMTFLGEEKEAVISTDEQLYARPYEPTPSIFFTIPDYLSLDTSMVLQGRILNSKTQEPVIGRMDLIDVVHNVVIGTAVSDSSGNYKLTIPGKKNYGVEIMAKDYLFFLQVVDLTKDTSDLIIKRDFALSKVEVGAKVVLKNIFFETGKATLKSESFAELENVIKFLADNTTIRLEISGHTDNVGSLKSNTKLSQDRAQAVVNYLVTKGIAASRLEAKGYAFSQPLSSNDTPDGRAQNRRVEFKILSK
jgi:outer membrane protein OmpA-like peptidoglycan-associated protein